MRAQTCCRRSPLLAETARLPEGSAHVSTAASRIIESHDDLLSFRTQLENIRPKRPSSFNAGRHLAFY
jgi:hypothetical protein